MRVAILGAGGFLGAMLARRLAERGRLRGAAISELVLADLAAPPPCEAPFAVRVDSVDVTERASVEQLLAGADVVFHLAAVVSGQAEADFDLGMAVNLTGSLNVFEAARAGGQAPVLVFTSSIAVFGGEVPDPIEDWTATNPQTSYGSEKAAAELILSDMSRRGFVDGRALRLPTISVRPGRPNAAASSFMSSIFREPLNGEEAVCPVSPDYEHFYMSPGVVIDNLLHGAEIEGAALGQNRALTLPGRSYRIGDMVEELRKVAGDAAVARIRWERDPAVEAIVRGWRGRFRTEKALRLGFRQDAGFEDHLRQFLARG